MKFITTFFFALLIGIYIGYTASEQHTESNNSKIDHFDFESLAAEIKQIRKYQLENQQVTISDGSSITVLQIQQSLQNLLDNQDERLAELVKNKIKEGMDELESNLRRDIQDAQVSSTDPTLDEIIQKRKNEKVAKDPTPDQKKHFKTLQELITRDSIKKDFDMNFILGTREFSQLHPLQRALLEGEIYKMIGTGELVVNKD